MATRRLLLPGVVAVPPQVPVHAPAVGREGDARCHAICSGAAPAFVEQQHCKTAFVLVVEARRERGVCVAIAMRARDRQGRRGAVLCVLRPDDVETVLRRDRCGGVGAVHLLGWLGRAFGRHAPSANIRGRSSGPQRGAPSGAQSRLAERDELPGPRGLSRQSRNVRVAAADDGAAIAGDGDVSAPPSRSRTSAGGAAPPALGWPRRVRVVRRACRRAPIVRRRR
jgi:hypothetical protein